MFLQHQRRKETETQGWRGNHTRLASDSWCSHTEFAQYSDITIPGAGGMPCLPAERLLQVPFHHPFPFIALQGPCLFISLLYLPSNPSSPTVSLLLPGMGTHASIHVYKFMHAHIRMYTYMHTQCQSRTVLSRERSSVRGNKGSQNARGSEEGKGHSHSNCHRGMSEHRVLALSVLHCHHRGPQFWTPPLLCHSPGAGSNASLYSTQCVLAVSLNLAALFSNPNTVRWVWMCSLYS